MNRSTVQRITIGFGIVYVLIGILGFIPGITVPSPNPGPVPGEGLLVGIFAVNWVHNIAHLVVGAALIWGVVQPPWLARSTRSWPGSSSSWSSGVSLLPSLKESRLTRRIPRCTSSARC